MKHVRMSIAALVVMALLTVPGCSLAKRFFGTPAQQQVIMGACGDALKDLNVAHAALMDVFNKQSDQQKLQKIHDAIERVLHACVDAAPTS